MAKPQAAGEGEESERLGTRVGVLRLCWLVYMPDAEGSTVIEALPVPPKWVVAVVLFACMLPIWTYLGGPPLTARSDGRYAAVSRDMAENDHWLVPHRDGKPHLTKPPLTYWAEAASIRLFGADEFAVRFPSAVAGSLVIVGVFWISAVRYGSLIGLLAAGVLSVTPLAVVVGRLTLTDGLLSAFWLMSLCGGLMSVRSPGRWYGPVLLWGGVGLGWMTKPLAPWGPLGIVGLWMIIGGHWRLLLRWPHVVGFVGSLVPIGLWAWAVYRLVPNVEQVWREEVLDRAQGGGAHDEPWWFLLPVFLVGMFPATTMLEIPGLNRRLKATWELMRGGGDGVLWALGALMPLVAFSIPSGKLPTYIVPCAAPLAILTGRMLAGWISGEHERKVEGYNPPEVKGTLAIAVGLSAIGFIVAGFVMVDWATALLALPIVVVPLGAAWLVWHWSERRRRLWGMVVVWATMVVACMWGDIAATWLLGPRSTKTLLADALEHTKVREPVVVTYGHRDYSLSFYAGQIAPPVEQVEELAAMMAKHGANLLVFADEQRWEELASAHPELAGRFEQVMKSQRQLSEKGRLILQPRATSPSTAPGLEP